MKSLKEIMAEQKIESEKKKEEEKKEEEKKKQEKKKKEKEFYYSSIRRIKVYDAPTKLSFLENDDFDGAYFNIERVITSILLPENRCKPMRYIDSYSVKPVPEAQGKSIFDIIGNNYITFHLSNHMYTSYDIIAWIEDGVYKALEFNVTRCPSGYCDGEDAHLLVATTPKELVEMIERVDVRPEDITKIEKAFDSLPNKERIIARTKTLKEEMMMVYWHPDRYEKWAFDDD